MSPPPPHRVFRLILLAGLLAPVPSSVSAIPDATAVRAPETAAAEAATAGWVWPVVDPRRIVRAYAAPPTAYAAGHRGIDLPASAAGEVRAPAAGVVHFAGVVVDRPVLSIRHEGGLISSMEPVSSDLAAGERVSRGEFVGRVAEPSPGSTWASTHCRPPCLHLGVRLHGEYVSPLNYLGGIPRSVLLPTRAPP